jgi:hypothetical protein
MDTTRLSTFDIARTQREYTACLFAPTINLSWIHPLLFFPALIFHPLFVLLVVIDFVIPAAHSINMVQVPKACQGRYRDEWCFIQAMDYLQQGLQ